MTCYRAEGDRRPAAIVPFAWRTENVTAVPEVTIDAAGGLRNVAVPSAIGSKPVELLEVLLKSWRLDPVASQRLIAACPHVSAGSAGLFGELARVLVFHDGRDAWQRMVGGYLACVCGAGFESPSADREAGDACLGFVSAIRDCIVETLTRDGHRPFVHPFRRSMAAPPLIAVARAAR